MKSTTTLTILFAVAHARFGQEQIPIQAIADVQGGEPGAAPTIAGAAVSDLLAGSNACAKVGYPFGKLPCTYDGSFKEPIKSSQS
jgi:hypothetical protein